MRRRVPFALIAAGLGVVLLTTACGSSSGSSSGTSTSPSTSASAPSSSNLPAVTGEAGHEPTIAKPVGDPPTELVTKDLIEGTGATVTSADTVTVQYTGTAWSTGQTFDSSWSRGTPATFPLSQVIPGWTQGLAGMKVGGRRELVIPPELAYGNNPPTGSGIKAGETLVFVVDMLSTQS